MSEVKADKIWLNGSIIDWKDAKIHIMSHISNYGTGVFEGIRMYETPTGPAIFRLREHLERFYASAKIYRLNIPFKIEELIQACKDVVKANRFKEAYIRPLAYKDTSQLGLNHLNAPTKVAVGAWFWETYLGEAHEKGAKCIISSWRRIPPFALPTKSKACGHYLNSILAKTEALKKGYDEAIMLDHRGFVSEGSAENIFVVIEGKVYTTPEESSIILGITRDAVITLLRDMGYTVLERNLTVGELLVADEIFFTGTAVEVAPVVEIEDVEIGDGRPGALTRSVQERFDKLVRGGIEKYKGWLTYV